MLVIIGYGKASVMGYQLHDEQTTMRRWYEVSSESLKPKVTESAEQRCKRVSLDLLPLPDLANDV